jgi:hypothetical protein
MHDQISALVAAQGVAEVDCDRLSGAPGQGGLSGDDGVVTVKVR